MSDEEQSKILYDVRSIPYAWARRYIKERHYLKRDASNQYSFGLFDGENMIGISNFGIPPSPPLCIGICGPDYKDLVLEFNRLFLEEHLPRNTATYFLARCIKMIDKPRILVSYADQNQGHIGYVYQALNWIYTGLTPSATNIVYEVDGKDIVHKRTMMRIGRRTSFKHIEEAYGKDRVKILRILPKHRYVYFLGTKKQKKQMLEDLKYPILPYPKGESKRYDAGEGWKKKGLLFKI